MRKYLQAYLREKPLFFSFLRPKEAQLYQQFKPFKEPVLDIGCGDGFFAQVAFGRVDVGIDPDRKKIQEAQRRKVYKRAHWYDGKRIQYPNRYFSTIVCNSTFEHIPNLSQVLREVERVTKKGGSLYFTVPTNEWPHFLFGRLFFGSFYESFFINKSRHYNMYSLSRWKIILSRLGFDIVSSSYYLDSKVMWFFDIAHYLSISSLITKKLFNKWVLFPEKVQYMDWLEKFLLFYTKRDTQKGPYIFIAAKKVS